MTTATEEQLMEQADRARDDLEHDPTPEQSDTTMKHSPGPWKVSELMATDDMSVDGKDAKWLWNSRKIESAAGKLIGEVDSHSYISGENFGHPCVESREEMLANAELLASAPALKEELAEAKRTIKMLNDRVHCLTLCSQERFVAHNKLKADLAAKDVSLASLRTYKTKLEGVATTLHDALFDCDEGDEALECYKELGL